MSESFDNGRPVPPRQVGENGQTPAGEKGVVPVSAPQKSRSQLPAFAGFLLCALGALAITSVPVLGAALIACGSTVGFCQAGPAKGALPSALALVLTAAMGSILDPVSLVDALPACVASVATAYVLSRGKMTPGIGCIIVTLLALTQLGADAVVTLAQGETISAAVGAIADACLSEFGAAFGITGDQQQTVKYIMTLLWPLAYTLVAVVEFACAYLGCWVVSTRLGEKSFQMPRLLDFDLPLWVVAAFVAAAAGLAVGMTASITWAQALLTVSLNVILGIRFALMIQGFALLGTFVQQKEPSKFIALLSYIAAIYLEANFFVMSIVGLVDVWANFRHLPRGSKEVQDNAK